MTNDSLLNADNANEQVDQNKDYLAELVGENKKFKTDKDLARGKYESDLYIETLKRQQDELRADYLKLREEANARATLENLIDKFESKQKTDNNQLPPVKEVKQEPVIDSKQLESLVSSKIQELEASRKQQDNFNQVRDTLKERFGNDYQKVLKEQIDTLGLSDADVDALARKSPAALYKTLGLDAKANNESFQAPPKSNLRSDNFSPKGAQKRTWAYYQKMKQENPKAYYDPKTNVDMHNDMMALGDEFKDGDFKKYGD